VTKGILYFTNNKVNMKLGRTVRGFIKEADIPITCVSTKPIKDFGNNIIFGDYGEKGGEAIARKILKGLENMTEDVVYFCEHDVLYHSDHFKFEPKDPEMWYYNGNYWFLRQKDGFAIHYNVSPLSGLVVHRESALKHFRERVKYIEENGGFTLRIGYEPFTHGRIPWEYKCKFEIFNPENPNVDVTHETNTTWKRWKIDQFRRKPTFWEESTIEKIPGWPDLPEIIKTEVKKKEEKPSEDIELSIVIPGRNEVFMKRTIDDILKNIEANTEVIAVLDGCWADPEIPQNDRVNVVHMGKSVGQRAAANRGAAIAQGKYIMKVDAHCSFDKGFDRIMIEGFKKRGKEHTIMVPIMRNLHAFDWKCKDCNYNVYQGPTPGTQASKVDECPKCGCKEWEKDMKWIGKDNPQSDTYCFDSVPHFQYFREYRKQDKYKKDKETGFTETMSLQGSCFMSTLEDYWKLKLCDEDLGNWGNQGIELACKAWLSGGEVLCNHGTWYAHMFRTQGGDFSFPWKNVGKETRRTKDAVWKQIVDGKLPHQTRPIKWLLERFWPVKGWTQEDLDNLPATV
jgi:glycosyltransferase involved in cell wall biosynthesis